MAFAPTDLPDSTVAFVASLLRTRHEIATLAMDDANKLLTEILVKEFQDSAYSFSLLRFDDEVRAGSVVITVRDIPHPYAVRIESRSGVWFPREKPRFHTNTVHEITAD